MGVVMSAGFIVAGVEVVEAPPGAECALSRLSPRVSDSLWGAPPRALDISTVPTAAQATSPIARADLRGMVGPESLLPIWLISLRQARSIWMSRGYSVSSPGAVP